MTDIADPYTSHGHDGLVKNNKIMNDETIKDISTTIFNTSTNGL